MQYDIAPSGHSLEEDPEYLSRIKLVFHERKGTIENRYSFSLTNDECRQLAEDLLDYGT